MAFNPFRILAILFFLVLLILSVALIYSTASQVTSYMISTPTNVCQINYNSEFAPSQNQIQSCAVSSNDWVQLHIKSQFNMTITIWLHSNSSNGLELLYNASSLKKVSTDFPIFGSGSLQVSVDNYGLQPNSVSGNLSVFTMLQVNTLALATVHPLRSYGLGSLFVSVFALFVLVWNPGRIVTKKTQLRLISASSDRLMIKKSSDEAHPT